MFKGVKREQKLLLLSTYIVGMASGAYLYLTVYATEFGDGFFPELPEEVDENAVGIRAGQYGDCISSGLTCPSYELDTDGVLFTSPPTEVRGEAIVHEDLQDEETLEVLYSKILESPLADFAELSSNDNCTHAPGDHYRYVIFVGAESYVLDTCRTNFSKETGLAVLLQSFFETGPVVE